MKATEMPLKLGELTKAQIEHMRAVNFNVLDEDQIKESKLAELAAMGFTEKFEVAMNADPLANASLALVWAAENQRMDCLRALSRFSKSDHHHMAACMAVMDGNNDILRLVLGTPTEEELSDVLRWACKSGNVGAVEMALSMSNQKDLGLIQPTMDPSGYGSLGALEWAIVQGHADCIDALIEAGWQCKDWGEALMLGVRSNAVGCCERVAACVEDEAELSAAFVKACALGNAEVAESVRRALPLDFDSTEALWKCAEMSRPACVGLAAKGAKLDCVDDDGLTLVEAVLEREMCDREGRAPTKMVEALIKAGAPLPRLSESGGDMAQAVPGNGMGEAGGHAFRRKSSAGKVGIERSGADGGDEQ